MGPHGPTHRSIPNKEKGAVKTSRTDFWGSAEGRRHRLSLIGGLVWACSLLALVCGMWCCDTTAMAATGHDFLARLSEAPPGTALSEPRAMTVERASGKVFVADPGVGVVDVFSTAGAYETQFGEEELEAEHAAVAVDEKTHDVYVVTTNAVTQRSEIDMFKPNGSGGYEPIFFTCEPEKGVVDEECHWSGANTGHEFEDVVGLAVDNSESLSDPYAGDVYVLEGGEEHHQLDILKPKAAGPEEAEEGTLVKSFSSVPKKSTPPPNGLAVDSTAGGQAGWAYVADSESGAVYVWNPSSDKKVETTLTGKGSPDGAFAKETEGSVAAVAVEESSGDVYVAEAAEGSRRAVSQFNSEGEWIGWITETPAGPLIEPAGVALSPGGDVYIADAAGGSATSGSHAVDVFGANVLVPDAESKPAKKVVRTAATLEGSVDPDGKPAEYDFQWCQSKEQGVPCTYESETTPVSAGSGNAGVSVKVALTKLLPGTSYHYRLVAKNANGIDVGADEEFTTLPAVELITGPVKAESPIPTTAATLTGSITPNPKTEALELDARYYFQYVQVTHKTPSTASCNPEPGADPAPCSDVPLPPGDAGTGTAAVGVETQLAALTPNTTYHYRLVATNELGTTIGKTATEKDEESFTTSGPPRITGEEAEPNKIEHFGATLHASVQPGERETEYHFEYGETTAYGNEVPVPGGKLPAGKAEASDPISATLTGDLKIGTTYHFRVVATNSAGTTDGPDRTFTTIPPALIESESAAEVSSTGATLQAEINPLGHETTYYFQYGTGSCKADPASCAKAPTSAIDVGSSESGQSSSVPLQGLEPDTTYHYRVLATNSLGTAEGAEHELTTQPASNAFTLPDGRAWELVSPADGDGTPIEPLTSEGGWILASEDGDAITYVVDGAIGEEPQGNRAPEYSQVISRRGSSGWASEDVATPNSRANGISPNASEFVPEYQFFTPDLSLALVDPFAYTKLAEPPLAPEATQATMYIRNDETGGYLPLVTEANVAPGTEFGQQIEFRAATPDLSAVVLHSTVALEDGGPIHGGLYEWTKGRLHLLSVLPEKEGASGEPAAGAELGFRNRLVSHAISDDGTRVVWETPEEEARRGHLYMRDTVTEKTLQLDRAQGVVEPRHGSAKFQAASGNGARVFFTDKQRLTEESTANPEESGEPDLYECEVLEEAGTPVCDLTDLTVDNNEGEHANVQGVLLGASEDGSTVYFVARGVLASNENGSDESAAAGKANLYEVHYEGEGMPWKTTFIAVLSSEDDPEWTCGESGGGALCGDAAHVTARVSPNGEYLAFMSSASLTGYDNLDQNSGKPDEEVYLYDAGTQRLTCISCNPTGARPVGVLDTKYPGEGYGLLVDRGLVWAGHWLAGSIPGWTAQDEEFALFQSRYLSDEGRLFFDSPGDLVPQATNHKEDVYEYEPGGVGSCEGDSGGCVSLISSGSSGQESAFLEATPSGNDVFFLTDSQLVPPAVAGELHVYDARVCSQVSPCLAAPAAPSPHCQTVSECRPATVTLPVPVGPSGSATAAGVEAKQQVKGEKTSSHPFTRAQMLANALQMCKKQHRYSKKKREACETHARKLYGAKAKKSSHAHPGRGRR